MWLKVVLLLATLSLFHSAASLNRSSFSPDFFFGTASSAFQYEGAAREGGKGPSIWDTFTHSHPDRIADHSNADVAVDSYHRYKGDVAMMKDIGFNAYRIHGHGLVLPIHSTDEELVSQKGQIGVTLNSAWVLPLSQSKEDIEAAYRGLAFMYDWFMEPLYSGTYPAIMVKNVGGRLPKFTRSEYLMVKGSFDFIGLNYYTSTYATSTSCPRERPTAFTDACVTLTSRRNGVLIGPKAASDWLYVYPPGIQGLLEYTKEKFNNPVIYITENGIDELNDGKMVLNDRTRIDYFSHHLLYLHRAIRNGVRVKGYFAWSLLDNFEWTAGYSLRFGLVYVDYKNGLRRYRKRSALWFKIFLHQ
ncbi:Beta-glucosidase 24 [Vigna angularis]|uniref:Beta-glucosidase 24 n=1 Tax=Phaseolus angularis TaxID=3914 RepID=A0A8T0KCA5_PHAAN|nr:Beta-glucosidase 24 [Vigna angularis]